MAIKNIPQKFDFQKVMRPVGRQGKVRTAKVNPTSQKKRTGG